MRNLILILLPCMITLSGTLVRGQSEPSCAGKHHLHNLKSSTADISRSDTIDLTSIHLDLDFTNFSEQTLHGAATIEFSSLMDNVNWLNLDLLDFTVDSILTDGESVSFNYDSPLLGIPLTQNLMEGDQYELTVYYHGNPPQDDSGWGGFYWNSSYAFNLGVGFDADPHNFGRAWFPCFDNFVERSAFSFSVLTDQGKTAICNGEKQSVEIVGQDSILTTWAMEDQIPSYLVSVAVGNYAEVNQSVESVTNEDIPIVLAAAAGDTNNVINSFVNLAGAVQHYENSFGPYRWNRVGFVFVPFNSGAMEHATNIAYPISLANGSLSYQTLMAHELSHHWWGDLVTCRTAGDMWINEGMATYCEALFLEDLQGEEAYIDFVRDNHRSVVLFAHQQDGGEHRALAGMPHEFTYGTHVYDKGADIAHNLRTYMGDEDFFSLLSSFLEENAFSDVSSEDFRDFIDPQSDADISEFFEKWVFSPGYPEFSIDSAVVTNTDANEWAVDLFIPQRLHFAPEYFENVPLEVTVMNADRETQTFEITSTGEYTNTQITSSIEPLRVFLNYNHSLSQAVLAENRHIGDTGIELFNEGQFYSTIGELDAGDSLWIRVENHFAGPEPEQSQVEFHISTDRFWRIDGFFPESLEATGRVEYFGDPNASEFLDPSFFETLIQNGMTEDSLVLVHRPHPGLPWQEVESYEIQTAGSATDLKGWINFEQLQRGDYAWAFRTGETSIEENAQVKIRVFPNPSNETITLDGTGQFSSLQIVDLNGKLVMEKMIAPGNSANSAVNISQLSPGLYIIKCADRSGNPVFSGQFIKQ